MVDQIDEWEYSSVRHYLGLGLDLLITQYEIPKNDIKINYKTSKGFEEGNGIGSDYFKF